MPNLLPLREGVNPGFVLTGDIAGGPPLQRLKTGATLSDLSQDYALFTYAPLFLYGGLDFNPINEWTNMWNRPEQVVFILELGKPVLNLSTELEGTDKFNCVLWAVEKEYSGGLFRHIASLAIVNRSTKMFTKVVCQEFTALDVAAIGKKRTMTTATFKLTTFSVDSNKGCLAFVPHYRPYLKLLPARKETVNLANAIFRDSENPYGEVNEDPSTAS